ncbi:hypothetical protein [Acetobacter sp.]|uniref:hypothetical protein n=1 Tax=Acetobacter sp. TaxID=440 RepID=UPI0039E75234
MRRAKVMQFVKNMGLVLIAGVALSGCADDSSDPAEGFHSKHHMGQHAPKWYKVPTVQQ